MSPDNRFTGAELVLWKFSHHCKSHYKSLQWWENSHRYSSAPVNLGQNADPMPKMLKMSKSAQNCPKSSKVPKTAQNAQNTQKCPKCPMHIRHILFILGIFYVKITHYYAYFMHISNNSHFLTFLDTFW